MTFRRRQEVDFVGQIAARAYLMEIIDDLLHVYK